MLHIMQLRKQRRRICSLLPVQRLRYKAKATCVLAFCGQVKSVISRNRHEMLQAGGRETVAENVQILTTGVVASSRSKMTQSRTSRRKTQLQYS